VTVAFLVAIAVVVIGLELTFLAPRTPTLNEQAASSAA
jgi:hypothetical protein